MVEVEWTGSVVVGVEVLGVWVVEERNSGVAGFGWTLVVLDAGVLEVVVEFSVDVKLFVSVCSVN